MTDDVAPEGRSVSSPEAPGRWQPYMPANGTEGDIFMTDVCRGCSKFEECELVTKSMFGEQPAEWEAKWNARGITDWRCRASDATSPAARSESEDTRRSDSEATTDDVDALVKAATDLCGVYALDEAVTDLALALQPFQKG